MNKFVKYNWLLLVIAVIVMLFLILRGNNNPIVNVKENVQYNIPEPGKWMDQLDKLERKDECSLAILNQIDYLNKETFFEEFIFDNYKIIDELKTIPADLDINSDRSAKKFRTMIRSELNEKGVNFAGHYSIVSVGMTGWGENYWIVDRNNGKAYPFPYISTFLDFKKNSNLIIMDSKNSIFSSMRETSDYRDNCTTIGTMYLYFPNIRPFYFLWQNDKLILLAPKTIDPPVNQFWKEWFN